MLHSTEQTRTYPCTSCGGDLEFHIGQSRLVCPHCGNQQDIVHDPSHRVADRDFRQTEDFAQFLSDEGFSDGEDT